MTPDPTTVRAEEAEDSATGSAGERIFNSARELFYRQGIRAVGVEAIAAAAGTTKMSLYRNFSSKDELVAAVLREQDREFWAWWDSVIEPHAGEPRKQIEALFRAFERLASEEETCRGCPIANAAVEIIEEDHPAKQVVRGHHEEMRRRLQALCRDMGARKSERLGDALMLLMGGAFLSRLVFDSVGPVAAVYQASQNLLDCAEYR